MVGLPVANGLGTKEVWRKLVTWKRFVQTETSKKNAGVYWWEWKINETFGGFPGRSKWSYQQKTRSSDASPI